MSLPQIIILCEDNMHMAETFKTLIMNKLQNLGNVKIYYTTDLLQTEDSLATSLNEFVEENGKYKIKRIMAQILQ